MKHLVHGLVAVFVLALISGCATTRTRMSLDVPSPGSAVVSGGKPVVIDAIHDVRVFETDPDDPSTPSLKSNSFSAPVALLAQARILVAKNKPDDARRLYDQVMTQYRDSNAAQLAMLEMRKLRK